MRLDESDDAGQPTDTVPVPLPGHPAVPALFTQPPLLRDALVTETSIAQEETVEDCVPLLAGARPDKAEHDFTLAGVPRLEREDHVDFLTEHLRNARYIPYDAARPWVVYWCLTGLRLLGRDIVEYRQRVVETFSPAQNASGGFGGGHGQRSHAATTYAAVLSLLIVAGQDAYDLIDRRALWRWLGRIKQADGGFAMAEGGEEDVRGAYCAAVIISLLALPLELAPDAPAREEGLHSLLDGLPEYLSRCQTYEGGVSGAPQTEAHGAYAFCVLGSLCILGPPSQMFKQYLDLPRLISWLSARQYAPEGGFSGRTNKLVDGCYSHWVGGCWPLIEASLLPSIPPGTQSKIEEAGLFEREGLIRYILSCCQNELGGLRDKPSARPDAYHSCYVLAGLSSTQYRNTFEGPTHVDTIEGLQSPFEWKSSPRVGASEGNSIYDPEDRIEAIHPVFAIPWATVDAARSFFGSKMGF